MKFPMWLAKAALSIDTPRNFAKCSFTQFFWIRNLNCLNRPQELLITSYTVWVYSSLVFMSQLHEKLTDNFFFFPSGTALKRLVKSPNALNTVNLKMLLCRERAVAATSVWKELLCTRIPITGNWARAQLLSHSHPISTESQSIYLVAGLSFGHSSEGKSQASYVLRSYSLAGRDGLCSNHTHQWKEGFKPLY